LSGSTYLNVKVRNLNNRVRGQSFMLRAKFFIGKLRKGNMDTINTETTKHVCFNNADNWDVP
jgi:hypothetical protein